jgi:hypothetical protein
MYRDGMIGARHNLILSSHLMSVVYNFASSWAKGGKTMKPQEFFPHMEAYFVPPKEMTRQERDFVAFTSLPGFKAEYLEILGGKRGR